MADRSCGAAGGRKLKGNLRGEEEGYPPCFFERCGGKGLRGGGSAKDVILKGLRVSFPNIFILKELG